MKKILVTGSSGFIGSFLVEGGLEREFQVWAGVRKRSSRKYLQDSRIQFAELDFTDSTHLAEQLKKHKLQHGGWDYIIHCAGVTKCLDKADFEMGNYWATRLFIETLQQLDMVPEQFLYLSSLSVFGPIHEKNYQSITETDVPKPDTAYGLSRPTGVYGPRERDYFLMAKSIRNHVDFMAGFRRQDLTFVFVKDLVQAIYLAIDKQVIRRSYFVTDGDVYSSRTFSDLIRKELGNPWMIRFICPLWLLKVISFVSENVAKLLRKPSTLNCDKYKIMRQRNWRCDITPLEKELGYRPEYPLERGVKEIIAWYKKEGWL